MRCECALWAWVCSCSPGFVIYSLPTLLFRCPLVSRSMGDSNHEVPSWVTTALDLREESICQLEVRKSPTGTCGPLDSRYYIFLEYLAHRAVSLSQSTILNAPDDSQPPLKSRRLMLNRREYPGNLNTLQVSDKVIKDGVRKAMPYKRMNGLIVGDESDNEDEASYPEVTFGYGRAKLKHEDTFVCVSHEASMKFRDVASIYFYAASPDYLRTLVNTIFEWPYQRRQPDRKPRDGKYELYTMELQYREARWFKHGWKKSRALPKEKWVLSYRISKASMLKERRNGTSSTAYLIVVVTSSTGRLVPEKRRRSAHSLVNSSSLLVSWSWAIMM